MTPDRRPVLIFDLDGTLLTVNSFPLWVRFMLTGPMPWPGRLRSAVGTALLLARRKAGLIDHETFKLRLQRLWQRATRNDHGRAVQCFVATLRPFIRPELLALVRGDAILATAAAGVYAVSLGTSMGFEHVLATGLEQKSNVGTRKRQAVLQFLEDQGWESRPRVLFTDHEDDLPLMAVCNDVYWFGTREGMALVRRLLPDVEVYAGEEASGSFLKKRTKKLLSI